MDVQAMGGMVRRNHISVLYGRTGHGNNVAVEICQVLACVSMHQNRVFLKCTLFFISGSHTSQVPGRPANGPCTQFHPVLLPGLLGFCAEVHVDGACAGRQR
jgi:hypothetical protein